MKKWIILTLVCGSVFANGATIKYASKVKSLYKEGEDKIIGRLLPTAEVEVLKSENKRVLLRIKGYKPKSSQSALYFAPNRRILNAGFSKNADIKFVNSKTFTEKETHQEWELASVELWSNDEDLVEDVNVLYQEANELFTQNCSICHTLHSAKEFNANQWASVIKSMKTRVGFDTNTEHLVAQYLSKNAKDMPKEQ